MTVPHRERLSHKRERVNRAIALRKEGKLYSEIAAEIGVSVATVCKYIRSIRTDMRPRRPRNRVKIGTCDECRCIGELNTFQGKKLCPACLNPPCPASIEEAFAVEQTKRSGAMACG